MRWNRPAATVLVNGLLAAFAAQAQLPPSTPIDAMLEARAALPAVLGPARERIAGSYSGLVGCRGAIDRFTLTLQVDTRGLVAATYSRQPWVQGLPRSVDQPPVTGQRLVGAYDGRTGVIGLGPAPDAPRDPRGRPLRLLGVFQDGAAGIVLRPRLGDGSWCEVHAARRGDDLPREWRAVEEQDAPRPSGGGFALFRVPEAMLQARDALRRECAAPLMPWLQQLRGLVDAQDFRRGAVLPNLFSDTYFVPHFGKPFAKLGDGDRADFSVQLRGSCSLQKDARLRDLANVLPGELPLAFMNLPQGFPDIDKVASNIVLGELRRWRDHARQRLDEVANQPQHPGLVDQWLAAAQPMTDLLLAAERRAFDELSVSARRGMGVAFLVDKIERSPAATQPTFESLERLVLEVAAARREMPALSEPDTAQVQQRLAAFVQAQAGAAADAWGASAGTPADAQNMARWTSLYPQVWALLPEPRRQYTSARLARHRETLLGRLAEAESQRYARLVEPASPATAALARLVDAESRLVREYGAMLAESPFAAFNAQRAAARAQALQAAEPELAQAIGAAAHLAPLKALRTQYLLEVDGLAGAGGRLASAWQARAAAISPFSGYPAEDYFSALYSGDFDTVRRFDQELVARGRAQAAALAPVMGLFDLFLGGKRAPGTGGALATEALDAGIARLSHVTPMLALYLGRWQREARWTPCLQPATEIEIITRVTETTRNRFGWESSRTTESSQRFRVPTRHADLAERVGLKDAKGFSQLVDTFMAPGGALTTTAVLDSVQLMMLRIDCDSDAGRRMDAQMVSYWSQR